MELDPAAERLDLVLVEHLGQLVELDLGGGVLGMLLHAMRLALDGPLQAADLRVLVDRHQARGRSGLAFRPLARTFSAFSRSLRWR